MEKRLYLYQVRHVFGAPLNKIVCYCVKGAAVELAKSSCCTCALGSESWRGEVGSSRRVWTFLLFRI